LIEVFLSNYSTIIHSVADTLNQAGFLRVLFPILTITGPALFGYFGYTGVVRKRTLLLGRERSGAGGGWVTGGWAVVLGVIYLVIGLLMLTVMGPVSTAMIGIW
jgi:hypothetical protein